LLPVFIEGALLFVLFLLRFIFTLVIKFFILFICFTTIFIFLFLLSKVFVFFFFYNRSVSVFVILFSVLYVDSGLATATKNSK